VSAGAIGGEVLRDFQKLPGLLRWIVIALSSEMACSTHPFLAGQAGLAGEAWL
jgi:hypothetical protein